ncbi:MAG: hypothetical protein ACREO1_07485 [Arenimonas sp.]
MTKHQAHNPSKTSGLLGKAHSDSRNDRETEERNARIDQHRAAAEANVGGDEEE